MSTSETITRTDLTNILNEVLPSPMMVKTVQYTATITWYSTSNPFADVYTNIELDGWTPIDLSYLVGGSLSSFVFASQIEIKKHDGVDSAHGYFRMTGSTPSSTTQNSVIWTVTYIKNAPMVASMADYIVEQGTSGGWTYRKWNSGLAEAWKRTSNVTYTMTNTVGGNGYASDYWSLPSGVFTSVTIANINRVDGGNGLIGFSIYSTTTSRIDHYVWITGMTGTVTMQLGISIIGRWK